MATAARTKIEGASAGAGDALPRPGWSRHIEWPGLTGIIVVAVTSLVFTLHMMTQSVVTRPLATWLPEFLELLKINAAFGALMLLAAVWARHRRPTPGVSQYVTVFVAVAAAALLLSGELLLAAVVWEDASFADELYLVFRDVMQQVFVGLVITGAWLYACTETDHAAAIAQCAVDSARMDEQTAEARLQMLEAQIEPHFLFNTLANVKRLHDTDRAAGARMLDNLKAYLGVALPQMRSADSTLGRELDHARAYLEIQQIRMGSRLAYAIDVDDALRRARLPPLMLLTLVENAIKHGLTPLPGGGRIDIRARVEAGRLRVEVVDTGQGFTKSEGGGAGLANIRARLAAQFGTEANLALALSAPRGIAATIVLPFSPAAAR